MPHNLSLKGTAIAAFMRESGRHLFSLELKGSEYVDFVCQRDSNRGVQAFVNQVLQNSADANFFLGVRQSFSNLMKVGSVVHHSDEVRRRVEAASEARLQM